jgi:hypothetical protein
VKLNKIIDHEFQSYSVAVRAFSVNKYLHPYRYARYAYSRGKAHYFGSNGNGEIYSISGGDIKKYNPTDKIEQTIGTILSLNAPSIIFLSKGYALYAEQNPSSKELVFNYIKLP